MKNFEIITLNHSKYGKLDCRIIERSGDIITVWCPPLPIHKPFDFPTKDIRFSLNANYSSTAKEKDSGSVAPDSIRYQNIEKYGCNQWPFSSLRKYLNNDFLLGFSNDIVQRIVPTKNKFQITRQKIEENENAKKRDMTFVFDDSFSIESTSVGKYRNTYAIVEDKVYLPLMESFSNLGFDEFDYVFPTGSSYYFYWLMNPYYVEGNEYLVRFITQYYSERTKTYIARHEEGNANNMNIHPSPVFRMMEERTNTNSEWKWEKEVLQDQGRIKRAETVKVDSLTINENQCAGTFIGSDGSTYQTTLESCTCRDFALNKRRIPCKHILRLAMEAGIINEAGNTQKEQLAKDIETLHQHIAMAYGYYYHFKKPIMSDQEYDELVKRLSELETR